MSKKGKTTSGHSPQLGLAKQAPPKEIAEAIVQRYPLEPCSLLKTLVDLHNSHIDKTIKGVATASLNTKILIPTAPQ